MILTLLKLFTFFGISYLGFCLFNFIKMRSQLIKFFPPISNDWTSYFFGQVRDISKHQDYTIIMNQWHLKYGKTYVYNFLWWPGVSTIDPEICKFLLIDQNKNTIRAEFISNMLRPLLGNGLLVLEGEDHSIDKKLFLPLFSSTNLQQLFPFLLNRSEALLKRLIPGKIDLQPLFGQYTLDVICKLCFNYNLNSLEKENDISNLISQAFSTINNVDVLASVLPYYYQLPFPNNIKRSKLLALLDIFIHKLIEERKGYTEDLLGIMLRKKKSYKQIRDQICTFIMAGNETTSTTLGWLAYFMAMNPEKQEKLYESLMEVDLDSSESINNCKYLSNVINEAIRLKPAAASLARQLPKPLEYKGQILPKNTFFMINISGMNRNPDVFHDPDKFIPERWDANIDQYDFIPFSLGFRGCIGKQLALTELKVMVAKLYKNYKVIQVKETLEIETVLNITQRPSPGVVVHLEKRPN
eukprot:NODE_90_length_21577_cov_0.697691.p5 type:complete len:469 gc:universal NODE_90_length_21577_cov_0.697691:15248-13842(-)